MVGHIIFTLAVGLSIMCVSYDIMARNYGWPVGAILAKATSVPKVVAFVSGLYALGKSFILFSWWSPLAILVFGQLLAFVLTMALKKHTQVICIFGVFLSFVFTVLYVSESKPFGFLHTLFN